MYLVLATKYMLLWYTLHLIFLNCEMISNFGHSVFYVLFPPGLLPFIAATYFGACTAVTLVCMEKLLLRNFKVEIFFEPF